MTNNNLLKLKYFLIFTIIASGTITMEIFSTESIILSISSIIITIGSIIFSTIIKAHPFKTEKALVKLFDLIDNDKYDEAESLLEKLQTEHGDTIPELAKAEAMLNYLNPNQR